MPRQQYSLPSDLILKASLITAATSSIDETSRAINRRLSIQITIIRPVVGFLNIQALFKKGQYLCFRANLVNSSYYSKGAYLRLYNAFSSKQTVFDLVPSSLSSKLYSYSTYTTQSLIRAFKKAEIMSYQQYSRSSSAIIANRTLSDTSLATAAQVLSKSTPSRYKKPFTTYRALKRLSLPLASRLTVKTQRPRRTFIPSIRCILRYILLRL